MKVGDLYRFEGTVSMRLYGRIAVYLGEAFIHRDDGVTVENHQVLMVGESSPTTIDRGLLKWMNKVAA
ncbi:MAG TPA: hypothetical protein EYN66_15320 [Myxococcales bacterium]|nr:hypothetical protein [Myxococcales bacterium]